MYRGTDSLLTISIEKHESSSKCEGRHRSQGNFNFSANFSAPEILSDSNYLKTMNVSELDLENGTLDSELIQ